MRAVAGIEIGSGPDALRSLEALANALAGDGPVLVPHAPGEPPPAHPTHTGLDAAVALATSGSTGSPKLAALSSSALSASAAATHERLGGPGRWLLALPAHHVAGLQVLLRSVAAGVEPSTLGSAPGFTPAAFTDAARRMADLPGRPADSSTGSPASPWRRYVSLVPTQLRRVLRDPAATDALAGFDAVLVGGAASAPDLLDAARAAGARVVTTYGMSETGGGCIYDGTPLRGVRVGIRDDGRIRLGGPTLASGYLGADPDGSGGTGPGGFLADETGRWFVTDDVGRVDAGRVHVEGRADDVVVTGGLKVSPAVVEAALRAVLPPGTDVAVVGVDDPEWGQAVGAVLIPADGDVSALETLWPRLRADLTGRVAPEVVPRRVVVMAALPTIGIGKPDRAAVREALSRAGRR